MFNTKKEEIRPLVKRVAHSKFGDHTMPYIDMIVLSANRREIEVLRDSECWLVRKSVAKFGNVDDLKILSRDDHPLVRLAVAKRGNAEGLETLSHDNEEYVRVMVANRTRMYDDLFSHDASVSVRLEVAKRTDSEMILNKLSRDDNKQVREQVMNRGNLVDLITLSADPDFYISETARERCKNMNYYIDLV